MSNEPRYIVNPTVVLREELDDWALLFDPDTGGVIGINPVGVAIWKKLDGTRGIQEIAALLADEFDVGPADLARDVEGFLQDLSGRSLIGLDLE